MKNKIKYINKAIKSVLTKPPRMYILGVLTFMLIDIFATLSKTISNKFNNPILDVLLSVLLMLVTYKLVIFGLNKSTEKEKWDY